MLWYCSAKADIKTTSLALRDPIVSDRTYVVGTSVVHCLIPWRSAAIMSLGVCMLCKFFLSVSSATIR